MLKLAFSTILFSLIGAAQQPPPGGGPGAGGGDGIWQRDALWGERTSFDSCLGHQPQTGEYHHHVQPICLRAQLNDNVEAVNTGRTGTTYREKTSGWTHSPILGWAYDGYPIYGPYGYSDPKNAGSAVKRMKSSFRLRNITKRDSLPDWLLGNHPSVGQQLTATQQGPPINDTYPLGRYAEDHDYVAGLGDLDQYNGRFTVTPDFPNGTYAYFVTLNDDGTPAFPYIMGLQYYGVVGGGRRNTPADAQDYFSSGKLTGTAQPDPNLKSWVTDKGVIAEAVVGFDPSAGPQTTWPGQQPQGARTSGSVTAPTKADVQRIATNGTSIYINSNGLPSYVIGPWFDASPQNGGVFLNFPSAQNSQLQIPRSPQPATTHTVVQGSGGVWVNGVGLFNALDGASYSNSQGADAGGGMVAPNFMNVSSASQEGGPTTPGALVTAYGVFTAKLASTTAQADSADWPTSLAGTTVTIRDSAGTSHPAQISYASEKQVNYRVPDNVATGLATVTITNANGTTSQGSLNVTSTYPGIFTASADGLAAAQVARLENGDEATLILYGTGLNGAKDVSVTIGGQAAAVSYAGAQGAYPGLDQINVAIPRSNLHGKVQVVVTAAGKRSNPVWITLQ